MPEMKNNPGVEFQPCKLLGGYAPIEPTDSQQALATACLR